MPTRNVVITSHQDQLIDQLVTSGRYQNASEVLREGLRLIERQEASDAHKLAALRAAIDEGVADADAGRVVAFENRDAMRAWLSDLGRKARAG